MENECQESVRKTYATMGITEKGYTFVAFFIPFCLLSITGYLVYKVMYPKDELMLVMLHLVNLSFFFIGSLSMIHIKRSSILKLAKECDTFVGLTSAKYREEYKNIRESLNPSKMVWGAKYMIFQIFGIGQFIIFRPLIRHYIFGGPREFMISGTEESDLKFFFLYIYQSAYMVSSSFSVNANLQLTMEILLQVNCKLRLLNYALADMKYVESLPMDIQIANWNKTANECAMHYDHIRRIFKEFRSFCGSSFVFIYFGLIGSITISRTAVTGDDPDYGVLPEFVVESAHIFYLCLCLQEVIDQNDDIVRSIFDSDWQYFPRSTVKILLITGIRSHEAPSVPLYKGGSPASLQTYGMFINASMAYFMSAIMLE